MPKILFGIFRIDKYFDKLKRKLLTVDKKASERDRKKRKKTKNKLTTTTGNSEPKALSFVRSCRI